VDLVVDFLLYREGNIEIYQSKMAATLVGKAQTAINFVVLGDFPNTTRSGDGCGPVAEIEKSYLFHIIGCVHEPLNSSDEKRQGEQGTRR
jgi:hypothetical protein